MRIATACFVIAMLGTVAEGEDLTLISRMTRNNEAPTTSTSYISSEHFRMAQPNGNDVIFDFKTGAMTVLDASKKTYWVMTKKDMDDMAAMVQEQMNSPEMKKMQEQLKAMPPEQQKKMQEMMGNMFTLHVTKSGGGRTIAGYRCENWTMTMGQISTTEECVTTELKLPEQAWNQYKSYMDSMQSMMGAMGPMAKGMGSMKDEMAKIKGIPLASKTTSNVMGRRSESSTEVTSVSHGSIPASAWEIPAGYTRVDNPMKQAMQRRGR